MNKLQKGEEREGISSPWPMLAPPTFSLFSLLSLNIALPFSSSIILLSFLNRVKILQYYELKAGVLFTGKISVALLITLGVVAGVAGGCTAASHQVAIRMFQPHFVEAYGGIECNQCDVLLSFCSRYFSCSHKVLTFACSVHTTGAYYSVI